MASYDSVLYEGQMGFRPNRGCNDGVYSVKRLHQWARKNQVELFIGMVDLSAAFDHIHRRWLFRAVKLYLGDNKLVTLLDKLYENTECYMAGSEIRFKTTTGVRQGGGESPMLYDIYADFCLDIFIKKCEEKGIKPLNIQHEIPSTSSSINNNNNRGKKLGLTSIWWLGYADDLCLAASNKEELQQQLDILHEVFEAYGLKINASKTETLILNWKLGKGDPDQYPTSICNLNSISIQNSKSFKYLGTTIEYNNSSTGDPELNNRIIAGKCKYYELKSRIKYLQALVRGRLTYNCASWVLTQKQFEKLNSVYLGFIRGMIRGGFRRREEIINYQTKDGTEKHFSKLKLKNEEIIKISGVPLVEAFIREQQYNWIGHCERAPDTTFIKQLTFENETRFRKKSGITDTTKRQVYQFEKKKNKKLKDNEIQLNFKNKVKFKFEQNLNGILIEN